MSDAFFLIGCHRSGTTALANVLQSATNADLHIEAPPKFQVEFRERYEERLNDAEPLLREARQPLIDQASATGMHFGDKNPSYMAFVPELKNLWDCKIVLFVRDGRDVVRSLMDWHDLKAGTVYIREEDGAEGPDQLPEENPWSYFLPRPSTGDPLRAEWKSLGRFEKCAWFWSEYNKTALNRLADWPEDRWLLVNTTGLTAESCERIFDFLGLEGFDKVTVNKLLNSRINSVEARVGLPDRFPRWSQWDDDLRQRFDRFAAPMMRRLGYYP